MAENSLIVGMDRFDGNYDGAGLTFIGCRTSRRDGDLKLLDSRFLPGRSAQA